MKNKLLVAIFGVLFVFGICTAFATDVDDDEMIEEIIDEDDNDDYIDDDDFDEEEISDDLTPGVVTRMTCSEIDMHINELVAITDPDNETLNKLADMRSLKRRNCMTRAGGRRTSNRGYVPVADESTMIAVSVIDEKPVATESKETAPAPVPAPAEQTPAPVEELVLSDAQIAENLAAGLCADGKKTNKFGCCGDAKFKDLGNLNFACCPADGGECVAPIQK